MSVLFVVIPLALVIVSAAVGAFLWSVRHGQFDDLKTPGLRMLLDDTETKARVPEAAAVDTDAVLPKTDA